MTSNAQVSRRESFPFLDDVIVLSDIAMASNHPDKIVPALVEGLRGALAGIGSLPAWLSETAAEGPVRRELYRSPEFGYEVLAIAWGPGQASGVHDHADTWGVEAVLRGELEVVDYRIAGKHKALTELHPAAHRPLLAGSVIGLLPPHDLHACRNAGKRDTTVSLHIYGKHLKEVTRYVHVDESHYRGEKVRLVSV